MRVDPSSKLTRLRLSLEVLKFPNYIVIRGNYLNPSSWRRRIVTGKNGGSLAQQMHKKNPPLPIPLSKGSAIIQSKSKPPECSSPQPHNPTTPQPQTFGMNSLAPMGCLRRLVELPIRRSNQLPSLSYSLFLLSKHRRTEKFRTREL